MARTAAENASARNRSILTVRLGTSDLLNFKPTNMSATINTPTHNRSDKSSDTQPKWDNSDAHDDQQRASFLQLYRREFIVFALLIFILLLIILWLPNTVTIDSTPATVSNGAATGSPNTANAQANSTALEQPWQAAQIAAARRAVQELLVDILDRQQQLEEKSVELWAQDRFNATKVLAEQADHLYQQRQFTEALAQYQIVLTQFDQLLTSAATHFQTAMNSGAQALSLNRAAQALQQFTLANAIEPNDEQAQQGLQRAINLPEVVKLLDQAEQLQREQQLNNALTLTEQALTLDPDNTTAQQKNAQLQQAIVERDYQQLLGTGYSTLQNKQHSKAITAFSQALKLVPDSTAAKEGLRQTKNQQQQISVDKLLQQALHQEQQEQWQQAWDTYQKLALIDGNLITTRVAKIRTSAREDLDKKIIQTIEHPLRLNSSEVLKNAEAILKDAQAIKKPGSKLQQQIDRLQQVLLQAQQPRSVIITSDNATEVSILRGIKLGTLVRQQVQLIPGNYTIMGSRNGYRDVRVEFTLAPRNNIIQTINVQCTEKIDAL